jgi:uncharacterized protein
MEPHFHEPDRRLEIVWSQHAMLKRTAPKRWMARHGRTLVLAAVGAIAYLGIVTGSGVLLAEQLLRPPRRALTDADTVRARTVANRTASLLSDEGVRAGDGVLLRAWWFLPPAPSRATVVLLHGQADNRAAMLGFAELLLRQRYRVLLPDARAHGASGGTLATYGVLERSDLRMWVSWAERQHPDQCVFGVGASMGGAILLTTLPDVPICGAVVDSAFADLPALARARIGAGLHLPPALHAAVADPVTWAALAYARARYGIKLRAASPAARLAGARVPLLVIHGTGDREVPDDSARTLAAANPRMVTLWIVRGAAHTQAWATAPQEYPARVLAFLEAHQ